MIGVDDRGSLSTSTSARSPSHTPSSGALGARMLLDALHSDGDLRPVETIVRTQLIARGTTARLG